MVEPQSSKLITRVRFPSSPPPSGGKLHKRSASAQPVRIFCIPTLSTQTTPLRSVSWSCPDRFCSGGHVTTILLILVVLAVVVFLVMKSQQRGSGHSATQLDDAKADARQSIERLGGQVYNLTGSDDASRQALADAAERYNAAGSQIDQAATPVQARLAKQTALEGLYYIRAARVAMGMDPGPEVPSIDGQKLPVRSPKTVRSNSRAARSPHHPIRRRTHPTTTPPAASRRTPGPAGWYSEPGGSLHSSPAPGVWVR